jgi:hypothetical protein
MTDITKILLRGRLRDRRGADSSADPSFREMATIRTGSERAADATRSISTDLPLQIEDRIGERNLDFAWRLPIMIAETRRAHLPQAVPRVLPVCGSVMVYPYQRRHVRDLEPMPRSTLATVNAIFVSMARR